MGLYNESKINYLLKQAPHKTVITTKWLNKHGVNSQLMYKYVKSNWFEYIAKGAYIRSGETIDINGGIYALQSQLDLPIHIAANSALSYQNISHFIKKGKLVLFTLNKENIPAWFKKTFPDFSVIKTGFLPYDLGITTYTYNDLDIKISSPERAILEYLYLCPDKASLNEAYQLVELMGNIKPLLMQQLLEECRSIKVKRLFLYISEKIGHTWFDYIKTDNINLGTGKRVISEKGSLVNKYQIIIEDLGEI